MTVSWSTSFHAGRSHYSPRRVAQVLLPVITTRFSHTFVIWDEKITCKLQCLVYDYYLADLPNNLFLFSASGSINDFIDSQ